MFSYNVTSGHSFLRWAYLEIDDGVKSGRDKSNRYDQITAHTQSITIIGILFVIKNETITREQPHHQ